MRKYPPSLLGAVLVFLNGSKSAFAGQFVGGISNLNDFIALMNSSTGAGTCAFVGVILAIVGLAHMLWPGTMTLYPSWQREKNKKAGYKHGVMYLAAGVSLVGFGVVFAKYDPLVKNFTVRDFVEPVRLSAFSVKLPLDRNWQQVPGIKDGLAFRTVDLPDRAYVLEFLAKTYPLEEATEEGGDALYDAMLDEVPPEALPETYSKRFDTLLDLIKKEVAKENSGISNLGYKKEQRPVHQTQSASCMTYEFTLVEQPSADAPQILVDRYSQSYVCYHPHYPGIWVQLTYAERVGHGDSTFSQDIKAQAGAYFDTLVFEVIK